MLLLARAIHTRIGYNGLSVSDQYLILINQTALNFKRYRGTGYDSIEFATCRLTALSRPPPARSLSLFALSVSQSVAVYDNVRSRAARIEVRADNHHACRRAPRPADRITLVYRGSVPAS